MNWENEIMKNDYYEPTADISYEELYQAFKKRLMEEIMVEHVERVGFVIKRFELELKDKNK